jgi:DNA-binding GntR family transcriptional regulator
MPLPAHGTDALFQKEHFRTVRGPTIPEVIASRLRDAIFAGGIAPGERLIEQKLAALFSVGQPTVREALRELEIQGFVRKRGNRGTYVTRFSAEDIRQRHEVRMALEAMAVEKAARNITAQDAAQLEALQSQMEAMAKRFDRASFHRLDMAFHRKIWQCANNEYLALMLERVTFSLFAFQLVERKPGDPVMRHVAEQHRQILDALLTRDPAAAEEGFRRATEGFWRRHQHVAERGCPEPEARPGKKGLDEF